MTIEDLGIYTFPGCIECADRSREENGDYKTIARISRAGNIKWFVPVLTVPAEVREMIEFHAAGESYQFDKKIELDLFYDPGKVYTRILDSMTFSEFVEWTKREKKPGESLRDLCLQLLPEYKKRM